MSIFIVGPFEDRVPFWMRGLCACARYSWRCTQAEVGRQCMQLFATQSVDILEPQKRANPQPQ